jgi:hypothetical protein
MQPHSMKFIYSAVNAVASGKYDRETEERVSRAIEAELLAIAAHLPAKALWGLLPEHSQHAGVTPNID